jgi:hypothetical protein
VEGERSAATTARGRRWPRRRAAPTAASSRRAAATRLGSARRVGLAAVVVAAPVPAGAPVATAQEKMRWPVSTCGGPRRTPPASARAQPAAAGPCLVLSEGAEGAS